MKKIILLFLINLFVSSSPAADGDLDASFGSGGFVSEAIFSLLTNNYSVVVQPDGKIISAGYTIQQDGQSDFFLARYNANGSADASFGTNGKITIDNNGKSDQFPEIFVLPDGKIILAGQSRNALDRPAIAVYRLNSNGSLDQTFGTNGMILSAYTTEGTRGDVLGDAIVQPDGKIVVTGQWQGTAFCIGRFQTNGAVDNSFGTGGSICAATNPLGTGLMKSIDLQPDGKLVVAGRHQTSFNVAADFIVFRFNTNGSLDTTFDGDGYAITDLNANYDEANSVHVMTEGKILAVGRGGISGSNQYGYGLAKYNANGSLDASFDGDGKTVAIAANTGGAERYSSVVLNNGKIIAARHIFPVSGFFDDGQIARFNANGSVDTTFGSNGQVIFPQIRNLNAVAKQADGKILFVGLTEDGPGVTGRLLNTDSNPPVNNPALKIADFDGDGKADVSTFRSSNSTWYINPSSNPSLSENIAPSGFYGVQFGISTDITVPADYDGDGKSDIAVFRGNPGNPDRSIFYILNSSNGTVRVEQFGRSGDNPTISGDWDGDGKADLAVFRPGTNGGQSYFFYRPSSQSGVDFVTLYWGIAGDTPIFGDFDGDRKIDAAVYRPSENSYYVRRSSDGAMLRQQWGIATDDAITAGDFDGDGKSDFAVYRFIGSEAGVWYILQSGANPAVRTVRWGLGSDLPVPADYDGDAKTDFAVFRRSDRVWYIQNSANGANSYVNFGLSNDFPLPLNLVR